jgi:hypothetical protein
MFLSEPQFPKQWPPLRCEGVGGGACGSLYFSLCPLFCLCLLLVLFGLFFPCKAGAEEQEGMVGIQQEGTESCDPENTRTKKVSLHPHLGGGVIY